MQRLYLTRNRGNSSKGHLQYGLDILYNNNVQQAVKTWDDAVTDDESTVSTDIGNSDSIVCFDSDPIFNHYTTAMTETQRQGQ